MAEHMEDIAALLDLSADEFTEAVADSIDVDEDWRVMLDPAVVQRTVQAVTLIQLALEREMSGLHEELRSLGRGSDRSAAAEIKKRMGKAQSRIRQLNLHRSQAGAALRSVNRARTEARMAEAAQRREARQAEQAMFSGREKVIELTRGAVRDLAFAVQRHRLAVLASGLDPEHQDRRLWLALDEVRVPMGADGTATLTEMLGSGAWAEAGGQ